MPAITYHLPDMQEVRYPPRPRLARLLIAGGPSAPSAMIALLSLLLVFQQLASFVSPSAAALGPLHEHLILGGDARSAQAGLGWHQHSNFEPHSHPITGSIFELLAHDRVQIISYTSNVATEISSYFGMFVSELLAPSGGIPSIPLCLLLPLGLAVIAFTIGPGLRPPAPPPKPPTG